MKAEETELTEVESLVRKIELTEEDSVQQRVLKRGQETRGVER